VQLSSAAFCLAAGAPQAHRARLALFKPAVARVEHFADAPLAQKPLGARKPVQLGHAAPVPGEGTLPIKASCSWDAASGANCRLTFCAAQRAEVEAEGVQRRPGCLSRLDARATDGSLGATEI
jgi:hypothetical protein